MHIDAVTSIPTRSEKWKKLLQPIWAETGGHVTAGAPANEHTASWLKQHVVSFSKVWPITRRFITPCDSVPDVGCVVAGGGWG